MAKSITFYIDNDDGLLSLYVQDRLTGHRLEQGKPDVIGRLTAVIANEVLFLERNKNVSITFKTED